MPLPPTLPSPSQNGQTFPSLWSFVADFPFRPARTTHLSLFLSLFLFLPSLTRNDSCISLIASPPPLSLSSFFLSLPKKNDLQCKVHYFFFSLLQPCVFLLAVSLFVHS